MPRSVGPVIEGGALSRHPQPTLEVDDHLVLRPFGEDDAPVVLSAFADPDIRRWNLRRMDHLDEVREWLRSTADGWRSETGATWAARFDGAVVGRVTLYLRPAAGAGEITYWVLPQARGRAVATSAVRAVTGWAHGVGLVRLEIRHSTRNPASCRVAERAGFVAEGVLRSALRHEDGWHDVHLHAHVVGA